MKNQYITLHISTKDAITPEEQQALQQLSHEIFGHIAEEEIHNHFYAKEFSIILAKINNDIVGYVALYKRPITYANKQFLLGGIGGLMVQKTLRNQGVGTTLVQKALSILQDEGVALAFHSVDPTHTTHIFYEKLGYISLPQKFTWISKDGKRHADTGGMVKALTSQEITDAVICGDEPFDVGEGYW